MLLWGKKKTFLKTLMCDKDRTVYCISLIKFRLQINLLLI